MKRQAGFTMIEVIVSLVLVAILAAIAGLGIVTGVQGYIFARENAPSGQKAQLAMTRLSRELMELTSVSSADSVSIAYGYIDGSRALKWFGSGTEIRIIDGTSLPSASTGDVLIDNVNSFNLSYFKGAQTWVQGYDDIKDLTTIQIDLVLNRADSGIGTLSFSTRVNPRNTGNSNGPKGP